MACLWDRIQSRYRRTLSTAVYRRPVRMRNRQPIVTFSFDDFPATALEVGGAILRAHGAVATYYAALGLVDRDEPVGRICSLTGLRQAADLGHELGCHTFDHVDAWAARPGDFERSILENRRALGRVAPGLRFETLSYPLSCPRPATKRRAGRHFAGCRGGGQRINTGTIDLNHLYAFFLEQARDRPAAIRDAIARNRRHRGWLIFVTHDIAPQPSRFGCTPDLFAQVVRWTLESGARILPVAAALAEVRGADAD